MVAIRLHHVAKVFSYRGDQTLQGEYYVSKERLNTLYMYEQVQGDIPVCAFLSDVSIHVRAHETKVVFLMCVREIDLLSAGQEGYCPHVECRTGCNRKPHHILLNWSFSLHMYRYT